MLWALIEGLAGVSDAWCSFQRPAFAPRWPAAGVSEAEVEVGYAASGARIGYGYRQDGGRVRLEAWGEAEQADFHVLLPSGAAAAAVRASGREIPFANSRVEKSAYADFRAPLCGGALVEILLERSDA
ncbi:MAG: hypothetical protein HY812_11215, partial [Planctomycetes bacterium]|nr:hypothetical protein [Planctomycetota bacterium]